MTGSVADTGTSGAAGSSSSGDGSGSSSTGEPPAVTYCVEPYIGGTSRYRIWKRDTEADLCMFFRIKDSGGDNFPNFGVDLPRPWIVDNANLATGTADCGAVWGDEVAVSGAGYVEWASFPPNSGWPDALDIDVVLAFEPRDPRLPTEVTMTAFGLYIYGDCAPDSPDWVPGTD